jgi:PAS domain S-box-containing protein
MSEDLIYPISAESSVILPCESHFSDYSTRDIKDFQGPLWSAISHMPGMAFRRKIDGSLTIEYASDGCFELTGYGPSDLVKDKNISFFQIVHPADLDSLKKAITAALQQKTPYHHKYRITTASGVGKWVWEQGWWECNDAGEPFINEGFITDISTFKMAGKKSLLGMGCFSSVVDNSHEGILVIDDAFQLLYVNLEMCKVMEWPREDLLGQDFRNFLSEESTKIVTDRYLKRQKGEAVPDKYELTVIDGKRTRKRLLISNAQIWHSSGKARTLIQLLDISDLRQNELSMEKDLLRTHIISEKIRDVIWTVDMSLHHTYVSPSVQNLLGYTPEELLHKDIRMVFTSESYDHVLNILTEVISCQDIYGKKEVPERYKTLEIEMIRKDGSHVLVEIKPAFIRDADGTPVEILGVSRDITLRKQAEEKLNSSREFLVSMINSLDDPFFVKDEKRCWILVNQKMCEFLGRPEEEIVGKFDHDLFSRQRAELLKKRDTLVLKDNKTIVDEDLVLWKGQEIYISIKKSPYTDSRTGKKYISGIIRDITTHKRLEQDLRNSHQDLEKRIEERTAELRLANEKLKQEINVRKQTESALRSREKELDERRLDLEEMNTTLMVLLKQRGESKADVEDNIISTIKTSILPYIEKMKASCLSEDQTSFLSLIETELREIASSFASDFSAQQHFGLTPTEIQVTSLIKGGKCSKEIAEILNISLNTVLTHRHNIRKKTGLRKSKVNLKSYVSSME